MRKTRSEVEKLRERIKYLRHLKPQPTFKEIAGIVGLESKQMVRYHYLKVIHNEDLQGKEK